MTMSMSSIKKGREGLGMQDTKVHYSELKSSSQDYDTHQPIVWYNTSELWCTYLYMRVSWISVIFNFILPLFSGPMPEAIKNNIKLQPAPAIISTVSCVAKYLAVPSSNYYILIAPGREYGT